MENASTTPLKRRCYTAAFLLLLVPPGELSYLSMRNGGLSERVVVITWAASAVIGILCALIGSGGLNKKGIGNWGIVALALHIISLGFLMLLEALGVSAP